MALYAKAFVHINLNSPRKQPRRLRDPAVPAPAAAWSSVCRVPPVETMAAVRKRIRQNTLRGSRPAKLAQYTSFRERQHASMRLDDRFQGEPGDGREAHEGRRLQDAPILGEAGSAKPRRASHRRIAVPSLRQRHLHCVRVVSRHARAGRSVISLTYRPARTSSSQKLLRS